MAFPYSFHTVASNVVHGVTQAVKVVVPLVSPDAENANPPAWWFLYWNWSDWWSNLDSNRRPNLDWCFHWTVGSLRLVGAYAESVADNARDAAKNTVRQWIGYARHGFSNFSDWVDNLWGKIGAASFSWASSLTDAATWLRGRLPQTIREGLQSWQSIWDGIKNAAIDWARARYEDARAWASGAYTWVLGTGETLRNWHARAQVWVDDFRQNTYTRVTGLLGATWTRLVTFAGGSLTFWNNLWGSHADDIGKFFGNPLQFLYDRAEDFLVSRW